MNGSRSATLEVVARSPFSVVRTVHKKALYGSDFYLASPVEKRTGEGVCTAIRLSSGYDPGLVP